MFDDHPEIDQLEVEEAVFDLRVAEDHWLFEIEPGHRIERIGVCGRNAAIIRRGIAAHIEERTKRRLHQARFRHVAHLEACDVRRHQRIAVDISIDGGLQRFVGARRGRAYGRNASYGGRESADRRRGQERAPRERNVGG